jgi:hypothetical protein
VCVEMAVEMAVFMVLTLWTCQLSSLYERLFGTVNSAGSK